MSLPLEQTLANLPPEWPESLTSRIRERVLSDERTLVVLDDDPTGTQTVYGVPVLTEWSVPTLRGQLALEDPVFFILTNSRSMSESKAVEITGEIGGNLMAAMDGIQRNIDLVSRSDSTLRGHYPAEVDALAEFTLLTDAVRVIAPFFLEGGRLTIDDVHYVVEDDRFVPVAMTPFARDAVFGFTKSNLKDWIAEKSNGRVSAAEVHSVSLTDLRIGGPETLAKTLRSLPLRTCCIVNAVTLCDMEVFSLAAMLAQESGQQFIFRTAASFVQARAGLATQPLLNADEIVDDSVEAGLIVVGSYVPKTTAQLKHLQHHHADDLAQIELSIPLLLDESTKPQEISNAIRAISDNLKLGRDVLLFTSRDVVLRDTEAGNFDVGNITSTSLVEIVQSLEASLRFLIAKGGITSSDLATKAFGVLRATVLGQILPGVPVWRLGNESRQPGLGYVIFPGNVGDDASLTAAYRQLRN